MNLSQNRTRVVNQLQRLLRKLLAGGVPTDPIAAKAATTVEAFRTRITPT